MADDFRRMPLPSEVDAFQAEVGRDQSLVTGRDSQDGAVIANPGSYSAASMFLTAYASYQRLFVQRQAGSIYRTPELFQVYEHIVPEQGLQTRRTVTSS